MQEFFSSKSKLLWMLLSGFFVTNALVAEFMGVKLFSLEKTLGFAEANWTVLGQPNLNFTLTAGLLLWPMVFIMTDIINEYYGPRGVRLLSYLTAGLIAYGFVMLFFAMQLAPAEFWRSSHINPTWSPEQQTAARAQVSDFNYAYNIVFGQSMWIIFASILAFLIAQIVDVGIFHAIKRRTGEGRIWMRATGSTLVSQLVDTFVVGIIALHIGLHFPLVQVLATCLMGYFYKSMVALLMTPVIYGVHVLIERYLGAELAAEMKAVAAGG
jgi:queuosine precursor transporter